MLQKIIRSLDGAKRNPGRKEAMFVLRSRIPLRSIQATILFHPALLYFHIERSQLQTMHFIRFILCSLFDALSISLL